MTTSHTTGRLHWRSRYTVPQESSAQKTTISFHRIGQLQDGEFDFNKPVAIGGDGEVEDMPKAELDSGMAMLDAQFKASGEQLSVLESLLFNRQLEMNSVPSREPIKSSRDVPSGVGSCCCS